RKVGKYYFDILQDPNLSPVAFSSFESSNPSPDGEGGSVLQTTSGSSIGLPLLTANGQGLGSNVSIDFGPSIIGASAGSQGTGTVVLRNPGTADLTLTGLQITGPFAGQGDLSSTLTLSPGTSTSIPILFNPTSAGTAHGELAFSTNDPFQPSVSVTLTGV